MAIIETVTDKLQRFINNFLKYCQENVDTLYGIDNDNSSKQIIVPQNINATCIGTYSSMLASNFNTYWWGYGHWSFLYSYDLNIVNGTANYSNFYKYGRYDKTTWDAIIPYSGGTPNADEGDRLLTEYIDGHSQLSIVNNSNEQIKPAYSIDDSKVKLMLDTPNHNGSLILSVYQAYNGERSASYVNVLFKPITITENNGYYICSEQPPSIPATYNVGMLGDGFFATRLNDQNVINKYITDNNSTNNYSFDYTTENGDTVTVYHGDNYVIYECDDDAEITYNENKEILDVVSNQINIDTGSHIHVPTYDETKYGPPSKVEDIETEMPLAYISGIAGMVHYIKINDTGLASADDISNSLSRFDITTIGKDLLRNFVSLKVFAILDIDPDNSVTKEITVAGHILKDANDNNLQGQYIGGVKSIDFTVGTVPVAYDDFRDYAPYTKIECYVPFCGWFSLPSWCIGKTIHGTMFTDICNGTVKAVIYADNTVVSEVGGCCAFDIPFVADATGAKAGAVISSALSTAAATAATVAVPNIGTGITAVSSAANTICAANDNSTTLKGVLGDGSNLNGLLHCYLKITRPQSPTALTIVPYSYKHEFGIPCYKQLTMSEGDGFTQVNDANIAGAMTDREKQMIIDGFRHGLIL